MKFKESGSDKWVALGAECGFSSDEDKATWFESLAFAETVMSKDPRYRPYLTTVYYNKDGVANCSDNKKYVARRLGVGCFVKYFKRTKAEVYHYLWAIIIKIDGDNIYLRDNNGVVIITTKNSIIDPGCLLYTRIHYTQRPFYNKLESEYTAADAKDRGTYRTLVCALETASKFLVPGQDVVWYNSNTKDIEFATFVERKTYVKDTKIHNFVVIKTASGEQLSTDPANVEAY